MKQYDAVIEVMKKNGGLSTLGRLYADALAIPGVEWKTKTPFASIRRIVQDPRFFFKIRPGLWALNEYRKRIPEELLSGKNKKTEYTHSFYQGLLVEIGNIKSFGTFVPSQDKNKKFLNKSLSQIATVAPMYPFSYDRLVNRAKTIDVVWFNQRRLPQAFFEVEHSTDIQNSLLKFLELQDFNSDFRIVADAHRVREFDSKLSYDAFRAIASRVKFVDYDTISQFHSKAVEMSLMNNRL